MVHFNTIPWSVEVSRSSFLFLYFWKTHKHAAMLAVLHQWNVTHLCRTYHFINQTYCLLLTEMWVFHELLSLLLICASRSSPRYTHAAGGGSVYRHGAGVRLWAERLAGIRLNLKAPAPRCSCRNMPTTHTLLPFRGVHPHNAQNDYIVSYVRRCRLPFGYMLDTEFSGSSISFCSNHHLGLSV